MQLPVHFHFHFAITFFRRDLCGGAVLSEKLRASLAVSNALPDSLSEKHTVGADFHNSFSRLSPGGYAFFLFNENI